MASQEAFAAKLSDPVLLQERKRDEKKLRDKMAIQYPVMDAMIGPLAECSVEEQNKRITDWSFRYGFLFAQALKEDSVFQDFALTMNVPAMVSHLKAKAGV